jgi:hypothetical protein
VKVKEKVEKPTTGTAVECRPEQKLGGTLKSLLD